MSLLTGFLRDALLQNVMQQDVYVAIRTDAASNATQPIGSGTAEDPYGGTVGNPLWLDALLADVFRVPPNTTIRFGPGTFDTKGNTGSGGNGWVPRDGWRMLGSGIGVTTFRLVSVPATESRVAIGMDMGLANGLQGFEASDFAVNANLSGNTATDCAAAGIAVHGKHIYLRRIRVFDFGGRNPAVAQKTIIAAAQNSNDCVVDSCIIENPAAANVAPVTFYYFGGNPSSPHRFCVIRNCAGRPIENIEAPSIPSIASAQYRAIDPGAGIGTIIEGNQIANCAAGVYSEVASRDTVIWNNYFRNVLMGAWFQNNSGTSLGRVILSDNVVELATMAGSLSGETSAGSGAYWRTGICLNSTQSGVRFDEAILRKNVIRDVQDPAGVTSGLRGLRVQRCGALIAENNVINNVGTALAAVAQNCTKLKFFNNQNVDGLLLRGYDESAGVFLQELEDAAQDVLLSV